MKKITEQEAKEFVKNKAMGGRKRSTLRLAIDKMEVGEKILCYQATDFKGKSYRHVYYMCKDIERKEGKQLRVTPNEMHDRVLIERLV